MTPGQDTIDKVLDHNRLQLSALIDGELPPDEARFLLRRLQHDGELGDCWERWQLCGNVLRGQIAGTLLPPGFAARVATALALEPGATRVVAGRPRWLRWGGGAALAASVAVIALLLVRQSPQVSPLATQGSSQIAAAIPAAPTTPVPVPAATIPAPDIATQAAHLATAVAVADVPRRIGVRRSRGQGQRAAMRAATRAVAEAPIAIAVSNGTNAAMPVDPFSARRVSLPNRPWPRALLPGSSANGAFTVDYGNKMIYGTSATSPSFYPFEPHTAPANEATDSGSAPP
jgi:negative regulator of sigma E activity